MHVVRVSWELERGSEGTDDDPNNPLSRAFRSLLLHGRPFQAFSFCLYGGEESELLTGYSLRWLGIFILSRGDRVIFFPGLRISPDWIQVHRSSVQTARQSFDLDHVSLEMKPQTWHFTSRESQCHLAGGKAPSLGRGRILWVGMSVAKESLLGEVRRETITVVSSPSSDTDRRLDLFTELQQGAAYHMVNLMDGARSRFEKGFLHFRFVVGPRDAPVYKGSNWMLPTGSPYLAQPIPVELRQVPVRMHQVSLASSLAIQISCVWLPGSLTAPVHFTTST